MGVQKKTRKFAEVRRLFSFPAPTSPFIGKNDVRRKENLKKAEEAVEKAKRERAGPDGNERIREVPQMPSSFFFQANSALVPPYSVIVDTSFWSRTIQMKLEPLETMSE
ncbi:rRNA-processing protein FCF1, partial [Colletotrichum higginsianum]